MCHFCHQPVGLNFINFKIYGGDYVMFHPHSESDCFAKFLELNQDKKISEFRLSPA